eukprot:1140933-Pelagomonas_calceolata.AAC.7
MGRPATVLVTKPQGRIIFSGVPLLLRVVLHGACLTSKIHTEPFGGQYGPAVPSGLGFQGIGNHFCRMMVTESSKKKYVIKNPSHPSPDTLYSPVQLSLSSDMSVSAKDETSASTALTLPVSNSVISPPNMMISFTLCMSPRGAVSMGTQIPQNLDRTKGNEATLKRCGTVLQLPAHLCTSLRRQEKYEEVCFKNAEQTHDGLM